MKNVLFIIMLTLSSCASYINGIHRQIDAAERSQKMKRYSAQRNFTGDKRPIRNPKTLQGGIMNSNNTPNYPPQNSRDYNRNRRYTANDFKDNDESGSLWKEKNSDSFLFVSNTNKKEGDIVIIDVMSKLKEDITSELKRAFPPPPIKGKSKKEEEKEEEKIEDNDPNKVHDKISTSVVEIINKDYLLVKGRKEVVFRKSKRYIEIRAVVSVRDINDENTVKSLKILEPKISVLRY